MKFLIGALSLLFLTTCSLQTNECILQEGIYIGEPTIEMNNCGNLFFLFIDMPSKIALDTKDLIEQERICENNIIGKDKGTILGCSIELAEVLNIRDENTVKGSFKIDISCPDIKCTTLWKFQLEKENEETP